MDREMGYQWEPSWFRTDDGGDTREEAEADLAVVCKKEARNGIIWRASGRRPAPFFQLATTSIAGFGTHKPK